MFRLDVPLLVPFQGLRSADQQPWPRRKKLFFPSSLATLFYRSRRGLGTGGGVAGRFEILGSLAMVGRGGDTRPGGP